MKAKDFSSHIRDTLVLSLPVIAGQLGNVLINVGDNLMVGRLGSIYLASAGLAGSIFFLIFIFSIGMTLAITPLTGEAYGAGDEGEAKQIFKNGLIINFLTGLFLTVTCFISTGVIDFLDQPPEVRENAKGFLSILAFSIFPATLFLHFKQYIEGFGRVLPGMILMTFIVCANVLLNWLLIYGHWGFPRLGLNGSAMATVWARVMGLFAMIAWLYFDKDLKKRLSFDFGQGLSGTHVRKILKVGIPSSLQYFFEIGAFSGALIMMGWIGKKEIAAHNVAIHLASITFMVASGISAAASIRVSQAKGMGDMSAARVAGFSAVALGAMFMSFSALVFWMGKRILPSVYLAEQDVVELASILMGIAAFFQVFDGVQAISVGALRGLSDARIPAMITFIAYWVIGLPGAYCLGFVFNLGMQGVWYALSISLAFSAVFLSLRFHRLTRRMSQIPPG